MKTWRDGYRKWTPWGKTQSHRPTEIKGVVFHETATHGGYYLIPEVNAAIPEYMRSKDGWYEEDCAWSIPGVVFPGKVGKFDLAKDCLARWYPDHYEAFFNDVLLPGQSYTKDDAAWRAAHANDQIVIAAWGDWLSGVPKGMVLVCTRIGARSDVTEEKYYLVRQDHYDRREPFGYAIPPGTPETSIRP